MQAKRLIKQIYATCDNKVLKECYHCQVRMFVIINHDNFTAVSNADLVVSFSVPNVNVEKTALGKAAKGKAIRIVYS